MLVCWELLLGVPAADHRGVVCVQGEVGTNKLIAVAYVRDSFGATTRCIRNERGEAETVEVTPFMSGGRRLSTSDALDVIGGSSGALLDAALQSGNAGTVVSNAAVMALAMNRALNQCADVSCGSNGVCVAGACVCSPGFMGELCSVVDASSRRVLEACTESCKNPLKRCPGSSVGVYVAGTECDLKEPVVQCSGHGVCDRSPAASDPFCR